jgi:hypothetical protein
MYTYSGGSGRSIGDAVGERVEEAGARRRWRCRCPGPAAGGRRRSRWRSGPGGSVFFRARTMRPVHVDVEEAGVAGVEAVAVEEHHAIIQHRRGWRRRSDIYALSSSSNRLHTDSADCCRHGNPHGQNW